MPAHSGYIIKDPAMLASKAQRASAMQDAAGASAELQQEVEKLKSEAAQARNR